MKLTRENLHAVATEGCGFIIEQLEILRVPRPAKKGWAKRLIGTDISDEDYARLLALKGRKARAKSEKPHHGEPERMFSLPVIEDVTSKWKGETTITIPTELVPVVEAMIKAFRPFS